MIMTLLRIIYKLCKYTINAKKDICYENINLSSCKNTGNFYNSRSKICKILVVFLPSLPEKEEFILLKHVTFFVLLLCISKARILFCCSPVFLTIYCTLNSVI